MNTLPCHRYLDSHTSSQSSVSGLLGLLANRSFSRRRSYKCSSTSLCSAREDLSAQSNPRSPKQSSRKCTIRVCEGSQAHYRKQDRPTCWDGFNPLLGEAAVLNPRKRQCEGSVAVGKFGANWLRLELSSHVVAFSWLPIRAAMLPHEHYLCLSGIELLDKLVARSPLTQVEALLESIDRQERPDWLASASTSMPTIFE